MSPLSLRCPSCSRGDQATRANGDVPAAPPPRHRPGTAPSAPRGAAGGAGGDQDSREFSAIRAQRPGDAPRQARGNPAWHSSGDGTAQSCPLPVTGISHQPQLPGGSSRSSSASVGADPRAPWEHRATSCHCHIHPSQPVRASGRSPPAHALLGTAHTPRNHRPVRAQPTPPCPHSLPLPGPFPAPTDSVPLPGCQTAAGPKNSQKRPSHGLTKEWGLCSPHSPSHSLGLSLPGPPAALSPPVPSSRGIPPREAGSKTPNRPLSP